jgi:UDP-2,3-diacylglucosamine hydrolase
MTQQDQAMKAQPETVALFISDLHLQEAMPRTAQAFTDFLHAHASRAQRLYLLGDLFEYWAGDDDMAAPFNAGIVAALRRVSDAGVALYWIAGNRDVLIGSAFAAATGAVLLPDPFVTTIAGRKLVLAHGDAQCTDDAGYMAFRAQVRQAEWQRAFLTRPLDERKQIIAGMRQGSRDAQRMKSNEIMDVNAAAVAALFDSADARLMIHGHTHRPALHVTQGSDGEQQRFVLPDWALDGEHPRGGWIALDADGNLRRIDYDGVTLDP